MKNQVSLKIVSQQEIKELSDCARRLWHAAYDDLPSIGSIQVDYMVNCFQSVEALAEQTTKQSYRYYWIESQGSRAGYTGLKGESEALFLSKIYLDLAYIGKGLGQSTLSEIKKIAEREHFKSIYLTVNKNNVRAFTAYERFGFRRTAQTVTDIGGGFVMDDYIYTLRL